MTHLWTNASAQKPGQMEQMHVDMGRSISHFLLRPHAPNVFCRFLRHIETFLDHLGSVDTPAGRVPVPKTQDKLGKYIGEG